MISNKNQPPLRRSKRWVNTSLGAVAIGVMVASGGAWAEGSLDLHPFGYFDGETDGPIGPGAGRSPMRINNSYGPSSGTQISGSTLLYVYAKAGEKIWIGASAGDVTIYTPGAEPGDFGPKGNETPALKAGGSVGHTKATISSRDAELSGIDGAAYNSYTPYSVTEEGIYAVLIDATRINFWDVTVTGASKDDKFTGRVFTYAYGAKTGGNADGPDSTNRSCRGKEGNHTSSNPGGCRLYNTHYYVTGDGYRYKQELKGLDPNAYALYSNSKGFVDPEGQPLYKDVRSSANYLTNLQAGVDLVLPEYPIFFSPIGPDDGSDVDATLDFLGIPTTPPAPIISDEQFVSSDTASSTAYVGRGGVFKFTAENVTSYQIVLSSDGNDWDPATPTNRVLTGTAEAGSNEVVWDGLDNTGNPFEAKDYSYEYKVIGRNGEAHFPFLDAEKNYNGGPVITQLNGDAKGSSIIYYDDRGYETSKGKVGQLPDGLDPDTGNVCGANNHKPTPVQALKGIDSAAVIDELAGANRYARYFGSSGNNTSGCSSTQFGDKLGLDLWVLRNSEPPATFLVYKIVSAADVTTRVTVPSAVSPGATVQAVIEFGNVGTQTAEGVKYSAQLPTGLSGVSCTSGATCDYDPATGLVTITGLPGTLSPAQWVPAITLEYPAPANGIIEVETKIATTSEELDGHAPNTAQGSSDTGGIATTADVGVQVIAPDLASPGQYVSVNLTYRNHGPLKAEGVTYKAELPPGMNSADVSCAAPAACTYNATTGKVSITGLPDSLESGQTVPVTLTYKAPDDPGQVPVKATIGTTTNEENTANNTGRAQTRVVVQGGTEDKADVTVSVAPPASAEVGTTVTVPVKFENYGPKAADGVTYTVTLEGDATDITCAPQACTVSDKTVTWTGQSNLANGGTFTPTVSYKMPDGDVKVSAEVRTSTPESNTSNNTAAATTKPLKPHVTVTITPPKDPLVPGVPSTVIVTCTSDGDVAANLTQCETNIPPEYITGDPVCEPELPQSSLKPGDEVSCKYTIEVPPTVVPELPVKGTATCANHDDCATPGEVDIPVNGVIADDDSASTPKNTPVHIPVLDNDNSLTGKPLDPATVNTTQQPGMGSVSYTPDGIAIYTPNQDATGTDTFSYKVCDVSEPTPVCDEATVTVTIVDGELVANDDETTTPPATPVEVPVLDNDVDGGDPLNPEDVTITVVDGPENGTVYCTDGICTFKPTGDEPGSFTYKVCRKDEPAVCDEAKVTININKVVATDDADRTKPDWPVTSVVMENDKSETGQSLVPGSVEITVLPGSGTAEPQADGSIKYTPDAGFTGTDSYRYKVCDSSDPAVCDEAKVTITVADVVAENDDITLDPKGVQINGPKDVVDNDTVNPGPGTVTVTEEPEYGTVDCTADGECSYSPGPDFPGEDVFTYEVCAKDLPQVCDTAEVTVKGTPKIDVDLYLPPIKPNESYGPGKLVCTNVGTAVANAVKCSTEGLPPGLSQGTCVITPPTPATTWEQGGTVDIGQVVTCDIVGEPGPEDKFDPANPPKGQTEWRDPNGDPEDPPHTGDVIKDPGVLEIVKTVYEGHNDGASCDTAETQLLIVEKEPTMHDLTWCFAVKNTGKDYLGEPVWEDSAYPDMQPVLKSGSLPLAPGAEAVWYYEALHDRSVVNTVGLEMPVVYENTCAAADASDCEAKNVPPAYNTDEGEATFGLIYDPPYGVKVGTADGFDTIEWTMVWVNDNVVAANNVEVGDVIQEPMVFAGDLTCQGAGETTVVAGSCLYDEATRKVSVTANFGADYGKTVASAQNPLYISFKVKVPVTPGKPQRFENIGEATWQPTDPDTGDPIGEELRGETTHIPGLVVTPPAEEGEPPVVTPPPGVDGNDPEGPLGHEPKDEDGNPVPPSETPVDVDAPPVAPVPVDNPFALILLALGLLGLGSHYARRRRAA